MVKRDGILIGSIKVKLPTYGTTHRLLEKI